MKIDMDALAVTLYPFYDMSSAKDIVIYKLTRFVI